MPHSDDRTDVLVAGQARERRVPPREFGQTLTAARTAGGWRVVEAARAAGISAGYWRCLESGLRCPSRSVAEAIVRVLALDGAARSMILGAAVSDAGRDNPRRVHAERNQ